MKSLSDFVWSFLAHLYDLQFLTQEALAIFG